MKKKITLLSLLLAALCTNNYAQQDGNALAAFVHAKGDSLFNAGKVPGILVGVSDHGKNSFYNFGYAVPEAKTAFDSTTLFEIGSITKTFTAYIVTAVLEEKKISDTSSVLLYLPDSVRQNKALAGISFISLLNHTSGLPRLPANMDLNSMTPYDTYNSGDLFSYLATVVPKPDGKSNYSNLGMGLAGVLAERITGKSYAVLLDEYIFLPFKLVDPTQSIAASVKSQGYMDKEKTGYWNMDVLAPAGGLKCSAKEMLAYLGKLTHPVDAQSAKIIDKLLTPTVRVSPLVSVGRGWHTFEQQNKPVIYWHNGGTYGFSTFAAFTKDGDHAVVIAVNKFNANAISDGLGMAIIKKMLE